MVTQQIHIDVGAHRVTALSEVTVGGAVGMLHGTEIHAGNTGIVGAGLSSGDLAPIGDTHLRLSWLQANNDGDHVWFGPCAEMPFDHWHFERFDAAGRIQMSVDNLHVWGCRASTIGAYPVQTLGTTAFDGDFVGQLVEYVEVAGPPSQRVGMILGAQRLNSVTVRRSHIHGQATGTQPRRGNTFENCFIEKIHYFSGSHNTCIADHGGPSGEGVKIIGCHLDGGNSAALSLYTDFGSQVDVLVQDSYFNPDRANYAVRGGEDATNGDNHLGNRDIRFIGNVFGRKYHRFCGSSAPFTEWNPNRPGNAWQNNTWGPRGPFWQSGDPEEGNPVG